MIALALGSTIEKCMSNHYYSFGGHLHRQSEGGAIGSDLTGEIARDVMTLWDKQFLSMLKKLRIIIDLYGRYVDDQMEELPPITPGCHYDTITRTMQYCKQIADRDTDPPAVRTAKVLQKIANMIEECI